MKQRIKRFEPPKDLEGVRFGKLTLVPLVPRRSRRIPPRFRITITPPEPPDWSFVVLIGIFLLSVFAVGIVVVTTPSPMPLVLP